MAVGVSEDHQLLVEAARDFARGRLLDADRKCDVDESSICHMLPEMAEMGFMNLVLPEDLGGLDVGFVTYAHILQEISYASPSAGVTLSVHNMVGEVLERLATDSVKQNLLTQWGTPENFSAFAITEADSGSDPSMATTSAVKTDGGYKINGAKMWISNGVKARWFLTSVRTDPAKGKRGFSAILIDGNQEGFERLDIHGKMGLRGNDTIAIHMTDVFAPDEYLVGEEGKGLRAFLSGLNGGRIGIASQAAGISAACLDAMRDYASQRCQFNQPIADFQAIQNMIADSAVELEASRALIDHAAARADAGQISGGASAKAKLYATEAANRIAYRAVQVHGATGYVNECRVEQLYRDARVTTLYEGTSEIQRIVIARELIHGA